jgi:cytochrome c oxidase assembly factor CtaG
VPVSAPPATSFTFEPLYLVLPALALALYLRSARRGGVSRLRIASFTAGAVLIAAPLNSPLETIAVHYLLLAHLMQNALIADLAPPLLLLGLTPAMAAVILRRIGPAAGLLHPGVSWPLWVVGWYAVHLQRPYDYALRHPGWLNLEHAFMILIGLCFWWPVIVPGERRMPSGVAVVYLLGAFLASAFLGLAYTFIPDPFYPYYVHAPRLWGIGASRDQNLGGVLMTAEQSAVFLTAVALILLRLLEEEQERADAQVRDALEREARRGAAVPPRKPPPGP